MEIYSAFDQNLFQSKFDKGHSHVDSHADSQVFTRHVMIVFSPPQQSKYKQQGAHTEKYCIFACL